jgi:ferrochelatase
MSKTAVLLVNLGSPASTDPVDVRRYLDQFLMDPYVIDIPAPLRALIVKGLILPTRPAKSAEAYAKIWTEDGSPLVVISERTRGALEAYMNVPVGLAMRYGEPSISAGVDALVARCGTVAEVVVVPMYPQYAMASTTTVEVAVESVLRARGLRHRFVGPFFGDRGYQSAMEARIRRYYPDDAQYLLFSYHGIPKRHLRKVDPTRAHCLSSPECCAIASPAHATCYRHQIIETTHRLAERLGLSKEAYGFSFQSRLGGGWLEPFTDVVLAELPKRGITRLAVVCPSFIADCLETLEEIDIRGREQFLNAGGTAFTYLPALNDDPLWIAALAALCGPADAVAP